MLRKGDGVGQVARVGWRQRVGIILHRPTIAEGGERNGIMLLIGNWTTLDQNSPTISVLQINLLGE